MTSDQILEAVLDKCLWPIADGDAPLSYAKILRVCDLVISGDIWPEVIASHGDYYTQKLDYSVTANQTRYRLPLNSYGPIRSISLLLDGDPDTEIEVPAVSLSDVSRLRELPQSPSGYFHYIDGDYTVLFPKPSETANTLRIRHYKHPGTLCLVASAATVHDVSGQQLNLNSSVTSLALVNGSLVDIVSVGNAHQTIYDGMIVQSTSGGGTAVVVINPDGTNFSIVNQYEALSNIVGSYLTAHGTSPIAQIPDHMMAMFLTKAAEECLRSAGDRGSADEQQARGNKLANLAKQTSIPRSQADSGILVSRNSPLRGARYGVGGNRW